MERDKDVIMRSYAVPRPEALSTISPEDRRNVLSVLELPVKHCRTGD